MTPPGADAIVMLSYDERYLYLAASVPRDPDVRDDPDQQPGRVYDADLATFDRLMLTLDVDRDYATWYRFDIDQRGWTRDAVWDDQRWNPRWHVAADSDNRVWRIEAAIPMEELVPVPPTGGTVWAGSITRITPGRELQSWTSSPSLTPRPETFGLIQFD
jgi:hypothetical protein